MQTLDIVIGIVIYFLFMSLVASALVEMISSWKRKRGQVLRAAVDATTNGGDDFNNALYLHPLVYGLFESKKVGAKERKSLPSYMPANVFAQAYVETVINTPLTEVGDLGTMFAPKSRRWEDTREENERSNPKEVPTRLQKLGLWCRRLLPKWFPGWIQSTPVATLAFSPKIKTKDLDDAYAALRPHVLAANGNPEKTLQRVAAQFNRVNDRVKGRYKRWVTMCLFWVGLGLAAGTNGDATRVVHRLVSDNDLRNTLVANADVLTKPLVEYAKSEATANNKNPAPPEDGREEALRNIRLVESISGGWMADPIWQVGGWILVGTFALKVLGFLITAFAVSLGAPFWFDLLNKLLKVKEMVQAKTKGKAAKESKPMVPAVQSIDEISTVITAINAGMEPAALLLQSAVRENIATMAVYAEGAYESRLEFENVVKAAGVDQAAAIELFSERATTEFDSLAKDGKTKTVSKIPVDTQAYVIRTEKRIVVAFRGTETNLHDFVTDARFKPTEVDWAEKDEEESLVLVHRGFSTALDIVWRKIEAHLTKDDDIKKLPVYFTGHSLGGALAVLAAARFSSRNGTNAHDRFGGLRTFGQPRVGNPAFAAWAEPLFGGRYTRAVNHRDIVPQVPPPKFASPWSELWEYQHFGIVHVFDGSGRMAINPGWFFRLADFGLPDEEVKAMLQQTFQNHGAHNYVSLYADMAQPPTASI